MRKLYEESIFYYCDCCRRFGLVKCGSAYDYRGCIRGTDFQFGADGPTAVVVVGTLGMGSVITEVVIGVLLVGVGIWGLRKSRKNG